jgi:hypothetical protein
MGDLHAEATRVLENQFVHLEYLVNPPRIVGLSPQGMGKGNLLADVGTSSIQTPYGDFYFRGGHRLWHSPEAMPRSYIPDNDGGSMSEFENGVRIDQPAEEWTHIAKSIEIRLNSDQPQIILLHELRNEGAWAVELAPWALTMLRPGGVAIFPQPAGNVDEAGLLPNRHLTLWPYASLNDSRLSWRDDFVLIHATPKLPPFKFGYFNRHGWIGYWLDGVFFVKRFDASIAPHQYPDGGCNVESYCNDQFIELETLGPLTKLEPGRSVFHAETWEVYTELVPDLVPPEIQEIVQNNQ